MGQGKAELCVLGVTAVTKYQVESIMQRSFKNRKFQIVKIVSKQTSIKNATGKITFKKMDIFFRFLSSNRS